MKDLRDHALVGSRILLIPRFFTMLACAYSGRVGSMMRSHGRPNKTLLPSSWSLVRPRGLRCRPGGTFCCCTAAAAPFIPIKLRII